MQLVRFNPLRDLEKDLDSFLANEWNVPVFAEIAPMDIYEEEGKLVAVVNLPNFKKDEINITAEQGVLEIAADHEEKEEGRDKRKYYMRESSNHYMRRVSLPEGVNTEKTEAEFKDGVLRVSMPKEKRSEIKKVIVR